MFVQAEEAKRVPLAALYVTCALLTNSFSE
jgi:hypothetical protein